MKKKYLISQEDSKALLLIWPCLREEISFRESWRSASLFVAAPSSSYHSISQIIYNNIFEISSEEKENISIISKINESISSASSRNERKQRI